MRGENYTAEDRVAVHERISEFITEFAANYELECDEGAYAPTKQERALIGYAMNEIVVDEEFCALLEERRVKCAPTSPDAMLKQSEEKL